MRRFILVVMQILLVLGWVSTANAHETRPATLDIKERIKGRYEVIWRTPLYYGVRLPIRMELPDYWENAVDPKEQVLPDWVVERRVVIMGKGEIDGSTIRFPGLEATITDVFVRYSRPDGTASTLVARPSKPYIELRVNRSWFGTAKEYITLGFHHIIFGVDHLLFVLGLLLIVHGRMMLFKTITSFTVAHSITLGIATLGYASAPLPPLNAAIALSILFLGPEIVRSWRGETSLTIRYPWFVAFMFGLLHGFGFASGLSTTGMPKAEIPWALLCFNIGVEIGQIGFVILILLLSRSFGILKVPWPKWVERAPGYAVGIFGAYWTIQRTLILFMGRY
jgi:hydrogenase/urease accessory protein HupE